MSHYKHAMSGDYCDTEVFRAECSEGQVILMTRAQYGRMELGRCVSVDMGHIGCHADVLQIADKGCSGRSVCEIRVPDAAYESVSQCMKELKSYLSVGYSCIPVETVTKEHCETYDEMNVTSLNGYISNMVTSEHPECTGASHPWVVKARPGQRINLTMYDFAVEDSRLGVYNMVGTETAPAPKKCHDYGIIKEHGSIDFAICGGQTRLSHLYLSDTHELRLWVTNDPHSVLKRFVIQYAVVGCADPDHLPKASWFDRKTHSHGYIRCNYDNAQWELICEGHAWTGHYGNCSLKDSVVHAPNANNEHEGDTPLREEVSMSMGIAIAIIIGAAFGLTLVLAIVCFFRYRRRRNRRFPSNRESILLRQKTAADCDNNGTAKVAINTGNTLQPVTTALPETVHLTSDTDHAKGQSLSANSTPKCMHHHYHNVKINGNDYEHIWQSPLPTYPYPPVMKPDITCSVNAKHNRGEPTHTTFKVDNRQTDCVRPMYITSMDLFTGRAKVKETSPYETCRYSTLPTKGHTRNNSCSKHQDLLL
ncbi:hypothetical protein CAPTEDRAFT_211886 [Capitella teleta]|uniref:SUEL-type lectin domain-containing protein n=1 Tax=Capitella teleta TaxID=283909 RepID=R7U061_CAPTE|nr:hypothetical protein CAPTEDRAFT_211886 [Capitella teleta]|eukprot:ELT99359.1 hypothetical protein CAPTEDRAFT_211886 [Capitella teleta]